MPSRAGTWLMAMGVFVAFLGLCFLPAALSDHGEGNLLGLGASVFSLGALMIAGGIYLKANAKGTAARPSSAKAAALPARGACDLCHAEVPAVHCKVHQLHLCDSCLGTHYDFRSCVYVPSTRRAASKGGKAMATSARGA